MIVRQRFAACIATMFVCQDATTTAFVFGLRPAAITRFAAVKDDEAAAAITDFMAKAHEEKIQAMARVEEKYKGQIQEMKAKISELEALSKQTTPTSGNSFAFPATNKNLTEKVQAYRTFVSDYVVKSQDEKAKAVKAAEDKLIAKYEAIIAELKAEK